MISLVDIIIIISYFNSIVITYLLRLLCFFLKKCNMQNKNFIYVKKEKIKKKECMIKILKK